jgi:hypothetical protein
MTTGGSHRYESVTTVGHTHGYESVTNPQRFERTGAPGSCLCFVFRDEVVTVAATGRRRA